MVSTFKINSLAGFLCTADVHPSGFVSELKQVIAERTGVPVEAQRLYQDMKELLDKDLLPSTSLDLNLVRRPPLQALWLKKISTFPTEIRSAPESIKADAEVVIKAVSSNGRMLQYATADLRNDPEIVLAAVSENGSALEFASRDLLRNYEIVLAAVKQNGVSLQFADDALKSNMTIVVEAVRTSGLALQYTSHEFRANPLVTLIALRKDITAIQYIPPEHDFSNLESLLDAAGVEQDLIRVIMESRCVSLDRFSSVAVTEFEWKSFLRACEDGARTCARSSEVAETQRNEANSQHAQLRSNLRLAASLRAHKQLLTVHNCALKAYSNMIEGESAALRSQNAAMRADLPWVVRGLEATHELMRSASSCPSRCRSRSRRKHADSDSDSDE